MQESRRFSMFSKVSTADVISNSPSLRLSALCHLARGGGLLQEMVDTLSVDVAPQERCPEEVPARVMS